MIRLYKSEDKQQVVDLVLYVQNIEYNVGISIEEQMDITHIFESYFDKGGAFWVAEMDNKIVGCLGLMALSKEIGVLKKFFIYDKFRGKTFGIASSLYREFILFSKEKGFETIILDTPSVAERSHSFYKKVGFKQISKEDIPVSYEYPDRDSILFMLSL